MIRRLGAVGALGLATVAPLAACGPERLSSLPIQAPSRAVTATPSLAATATPSGEPVAPPARRAVPPPPRPVEPPVVESTPPPSPTSSCADAREFDLSDDEVTPPTSMCFRPGGVLRLQNVAAGAVTVEPAESADTPWEAGVQQVIFRDLGIVSVSFPHGEQTRTITVSVEA